MSGDRTPRIRLIGGQELGPPPGDHSLHRTLFTRLPREVKHTGSLTRYVGFDSFVDGGTPVRFLGIEVERIEDLPEGLVAWELIGSTWRIRQARDGEEVVTWQEDVVWQWSDPGPGGSGRLTGEFCAQGPEEWRSGDRPAVRDFRVTANAYVSPHQRAPADEVQLADHEPSWAQQFEEMAGWIRDQFGSDLALRVEHYGSTAIPGMPAKPVIDILVEIPSFPAAKKRALPCLNAEAWEYWWYRDHMLFVKRNGLMGPRTHHVHLAPRGHDLWQGLAFRDYLRSHAEDAARYAVLKQQLASAHRGDREKYTEAKAEFVAEITASALRDLPRGLS